MCERVERKMSKRKALSFDEKREKMLEIFTETSEFFTLKELEKIAPKRKGIVSQTVKEVLQSLVDDDMVSSDKCGVQTVFWCLPSESVQKKRARLSKLDETIAAKAAALEKMTAEQELLAKGREQSDTRDAVIQELEVKRQHVADMRAQLGQFAACDPETFAEMKSGLEVCVEAVNRWVDNISTLRSFANNTMGVSNEEFNSAFDLPADLDYVELEAL
ncbi:Meiotic nuclear division protein 1-like [Porphyridium purpureum]|uniref:Meiotic nuclear division protein 1 homolog n=1 Tax=Porphyridium purpureum TaxID=35688 RepID=A0A5J4Z954_PORPP|nr:Meiotic nuclear division protein 1-like [Porphyridium purpureum]|eukprot:POR3271..scf295_1